MSTEARADAEIPFTPRRTGISALVRAPSIPPRRKDSLMSETKRVAVVLRRGMKQTEFRNVEEQLDMHNLTCLPVLAGQRRMTVSDTPVCGFIVTGGDMDPSHAERDLIMGTVRETLDRDIPVVAMSEAVPSSQACRKAFTAVSAASRPPASPPIPSTTRRTGTR